jgi:hypothetical protein
MRATLSNVPDWFRTNLVNAGLAYNPTKLPAVKITQRQYGLPKRIKLKEIDPNAPLDTFQIGSGKIWHGPNLAYNPTKLPAFKTNVNTDENKDVNVDIFQTATQQNAPRVGDLDVGRRCDHEKEG